MLLKRAISAAVILYALIFLAASVLLTYRLQDPIFGAASVAIATILTFYIAKDYYFKGLDVRHPMREGLLLGAIIIVVTAVIEVALMVHGFASQRGWTYFYAWHILLGYFLMVAVPVIAAYRVRAKRSKAKQRPRPKPKSRPKSRSGRRRR